MLSNVSVSVSALLKMEVALLTVCVICLAISLQALNKAIRTRRIIVRREAEYEARVGTAVAVFGCSCICLAQAIMVYWGIDRGLILIETDESHVHATAFVRYGIFRVSVSILLASMTWVKSYVYRRLEERSN